MNVGNLFNFGGRIGRGEYWTRNIASVLLLMLLKPIAGTVNSVGVGFVIVGVVYLAVVVFSLSTSIKRLHDQDMSGAGVLIILVPFIGQFWWLIKTGVMPGDSGANTYGLPGNGSVTYEPGPDTYVLPSRYS